MNNLIIRVDKVKDLVLLEYAQGFIDAHIKREAEKKQAKLKTLIKNKVELQYR